MSQPITILGGGLAGLTLGIGLRQTGVPTTIIEAGQYPRHRVCGEFVSGRGQAALERLGLRPLFTAAGATEARTAAFFLGRRATPTVPLPEPALCLSRWQMDTVLAGRFQALGGVLRTGERVPPGETRSGCVRATGRRPATDPAGPRWFGLKIHARNVALQAGLELHFSARGYVGLCMVEGGEVNICGLFRREPGAGASAAELRQLLADEPGTALHERLAGAAFDEASFSAIAGLSLSPVRAASRPELSVGDAITMIPPLSGNGMSMAFESAELAVAPLAAWSRGECSWAAAQAAIARGCDQRFARRLFWAGGLQRIILRPAWQTVLLRLAAGCSGFTRIAFALTR